MRGVLGVPVGAVIAAVLMFLWGFAYWGSGVVDPFQHMKNEIPVANAMDALFPESGTYFIPDQGIGTMENWVERHKAASIAIIHYQKEGTDPMAPMKMVSGFVHFLVFALLTGVLLLVAGADCYVKRFALVIVAGLGATVFLHFQTPIWFHAPWGFHILYFVYSLVCYVIAAAVLAYFVKPSAATA